MAHLGNFAKRQVFLGTVCVATLKSLLPIEQTLSSTTNSLPLWPHILPTVNDANHEEGREEDVHHAV